MFSGSPNPDNYRDGVARACPESKANREARLHGGENLEFRMRNDEWGSFDVMSDRF